MLTNHHRTLLSICRLKLRVDQSFSPLPCLSPLSRCQSPLCRLSCFCVCLQLVGSSSLRCFCARMSSLRSSRLSTSATSCRW